MIIDPRGTSPVRHLAALDLLGENTVCVHGVWLDDEDLDLLAKTGTSVVTCPQSNLKLASGIARIAEMLAEEYHRRSRHRRLRQQQQPGHVQGDGYARQDPEGAAAGRHRPAGPGRPPLRHDRQCQAAESPHDSAGSRSAIGPT